MGFKSSTFTTFEPSISELVARGVKEMMGIARVVDSP
jgi:hypothetical protein